MTNFLLSFIFGFMGGLFIIFIILVVVIIVSINKQKDKAMSTWKCGSCGEQRPIKLIDSLTYKKANVTFNIDYCRDSKKCTTFAKQFIGACKNDLRKKD